jgi:hypothetical protein
MHSDQVSTLGSNAENTLERGRYDLRLRMLNNDSASVANFYFSPLLSLPTSPEWRT